MTGRAWLIAAIWLDSLVFCVVTFAALGCWLFGNIASAQWFGVAMGSTFVIGVLLARLDLVLERDR